jgi:hypothetical protein
MGRLWILAFKQDWRRKRVVGLWRWRVDRQGARAFACARARATPGSGVCEHLGHGRIRAHRAQARAEHGAGVCDYHGRGRIPAPALWRRRARSVPGQATRRPARRPARGRAQEGRVTFWAPRAVRGALGRRIGAVARAGSRAPGAQRHGSPVGGPVQVGPQVVHRSTNFDTRLSAEWRCCHRGLRS